MKTFLLIAALGAGLTSGVLFAFSSFIIAGLARIPPQSGMTAMQSINVTVINPVFMTVFLGTGVMAVAAIVMGLRSGGGGGQAFMIAAAVVYLVGVLGVTFGGNIPLNNMLAAADPGTAEGLGQWRTYLSSWTMWNHLRTVSALLSTGMFILSRG